MGAAVGLVIVVLFFVAVASHFTHTHAAPAAQAVTAAR
jgi:hypothetical protein